MIQMPRFFRTEAVAESQRRMSAGATRIGVAREAVGGTDRVASLAALFPNAIFDEIAGGWPEGCSQDTHILIAAVDGDSERDIEAAARRLRQKASDLNIVIVLRDASFAASRRLTREGAADVLPAPASETALAISLERLLAKLFRFSKRAAGSAQPRLESRPLLFLPAGAPSARSVSSIWTFNSALRRSISICQTP